MNLSALGRDERSRAVAAATEARGHRAAVKLALKSGELTLAQVFDRVDPLLDRLPVVELLRALPRVGPVRAAALIEQVGIAPNRRLAGLGASQRAELLRRLA